MAWKKAPAYSAAYLGSGTFRTSKPKHENSKLKEVRAKRRSRHSRWTQANPRGLSVLRAPLNSHLSGEAPRSVRASPRSLEIGQTECTELRTPTSAWHLLAHGPDLLRFERSANRVITFGGTTRF